MHNKSQQMDTQTYSLWQWQLPGPNVYAIHVYYIQCRHSSHLSNKVGNDLRMLVCNWTLCLSILWVLDPLLDLLDIPHGSLEAGNRILIVINDFISLLGVWSLIPCVFTYTWSAVIWSSIADSSAHAQEGEIKDVLKLNTTIPWILPALEFFLHWLSGSSWMK